jgi:ceramide glucosyltransferase
LEGVFVASLDALCGILGAASCAYLAFAVWCVRRFKADLGSNALAHRPPLAILKPLYGYEPHLYECLRSFCAQDYPDLQIICGLAAPDDPAAEVVRRLNREFPERDIALVVDGTVHGANPKVSSLINMVGTAKHDVLVLSDSDVRLDSRDFLLRVIPSLGDPRVGAVTCPYRALADIGLANALGALHIDDWYFPQTLIAERIGPVDSCLGPLTAVRREAIERIGGLRALADHVADDYMLGQLVARSGYRVRLSRAIADTVVAEDFPSLVRRELRWARTIRATQPLGHAASIVTHSLPIMLGLVALHPNAMGGLLLATVFLLRLILRGAVQRKLRGSGSARLWLVPLREILCFLVWLASHASRRVMWRESAFAIAPDGTLRLRMRRVPSSIAAALARDIGPTRTV